MTETETILKIHKNRPIDINLLSNLKLELFIKNIDLVNKDLTDTPYYHIDCSYVDKEELKIFTKKIIKHYIKKHLTVHLKLFSIEGDLIVRVDDIYK